MIYSGHSATNEAVAIKVADIKAQIAEASGIGDSVSINYGNGHSMIFVRIKPDRFAAVNNKGVLVDDNNTPAYVNHRYSLYPVSELIEIAKYQSKRKDWNGISIKKHAYDVKALMRTADRDPERDDGKSPASRIASRLSGGK